MGMTSTSTQLATRNGAAATELASRLAPAEWTREYLDTIKAVFGKGCTDSEFALAVQVSKTTGLRIDTRELWVYKRAANEPMTLAISIDGFRAIAHASGTYQGEEGPLYCGKDGVWSEVWTGEGLPHAAKFSVWRSDFARPFTAVILVAEFAKLGGFLWGKAPVWMAGIRVATHAYRKAYRQEIARRELDAQAMGAPLAVGGHDEAAAVDAEAEAVAVDPTTGEILTVAPAESTFSTSPTPLEIAREDAITRYQAAWDRLHDRDVTPEWRDAKGVTHAYPRNVPAAATADRITTTASTLEADYATRFEPHKASARGADE